MLEILEGAGNDESVNSVENVIDSEGDWICWEVLNILEMLEMLEGAGNAKNSGKCRELLGCWKIFNNADNAGNTIK